MNSLALGLVETVGMVPAIEAADSAVKAADVTLSPLMFAGKGIVTVVIRGDISSVKASVAAAELAAKPFGKTRSSTVIGRTAEGLTDKVLDGTAGPIAKRSMATATEPLQTKEKEQPESYDQGRLGTMKVIHLRQLARKIDGFPMVKSKIKFAKKDELIRLLLQYKKDREK